MKSDRAPRNARRPLNSAARDSAEETPGTSNRFSAPIARPLWLWVSGIFLATWLAVLAWLAWRG